MTFCLFAIKHLIEAGEREAAADEMDGHEPRADEVGEMMEKVGICHAVDTCEDGKEKEEGAGYIAESAGGWIVSGFITWMKIESEGEGIPRSYSGDHLSSGEGFN